MAGVDVSFLPLIYNILKGVGKDSYDVNQSISDLQAKLALAREQIEQLPGIDLSKEDQEHQIHILEQQLAKKTQLIKEYRNISKFDVTLSK